MCTKRSIFLSAVLLCVLALPELARVRLAVF